ncbi:MAG: hypothetical protein DMD35_06330 [Gemmatimonadetes bacterium]|nr:MAG: hypothetical protein DMD35_06330 [Gemmatimonadota bacterium]
MKIRTAVGVALIALSPLGVVRAQISNPLKFTFFGGPALPIGDLDDQVKPGFTVGGAVDLRVPLSPVGFRGEIVYSAFNADTPSGSGVNRDVNDFGANANVVAWLTLPTAGVIRPYFTAGPSYAQLTDTDNHWGFNAGLGVQSALGLIGTRFDVRYRRISTSGSAYQIVPITFGITF